MVENLLAVLVQILLNGRGDVLVELFWVPVTQTVTLCDDSFPKIQSVTLAAGISFCGAVGVTDHTCDFRRWVLMASLTIIGRSSVWSQILFGILCDE